MSCHSEGAARRICFRLYKSRSFASLRMTVGSFLSRILVFTAVEHVAAAVLRPASFAVIAAARVFLAPAHPLHPFFCRAPPHEHAPPPLAPAVAPRAGGFAA